MPNTMKSTQSARLSPETVKAIQAFRKAVEKETKKTPSINASINALILRGWNCVQANTEADKVSG